ncbi:WD40/YVTN/BNR-like repeat-containing protein [Shewanella pealeana]|uniref:Glycosyl hydrolase, BNR repeat-containing protein n=1 Tax=Shewanella pealeana (strain ATCC 700345 / ANG-SQ1) TaxID=398579 RepID=A8H9J3_SHEPA|nr:oxidoreductase [Shewanella pealeana]ABV89230.1 glycosyl hydrolase, BNR repeat-containing protein [Shewanella pealeana ATCC 700345]
MKIFMLLISLFSFATVAMEWNIQSLAPGVSFRGSAVLDGVVWVTGTDNRVYISKDSGNSWQDVSVKGLPLTDFRDIEVFDANTAIVMGAGEGGLSKLYITQNQGLSWQLLFDNPDELGFFNSIAFWDRNNGLLLGDPVGGCYVILRTSDGGKSWQRVAQGELPEMLDKEVAFAASGNTLIVGKRGRAWFTTGGYSSSAYSSADSGQHWRRRPIALYDDTQTAGGYALAFNHLGDLFVLGGDYQQRDKFDANMVYRKGYVWHKAPGTTPGLRTAMACYQEICIATGKLSSDISIDHGYSWQPLLINGQAQGFFTLAIDGNTLVAGGHDGRVAVYTFE